MCLRVAYLILVGLAICFRVGYPTIFTDYFTYLLELGTLPFSIRIVGEIFPENFLIWTTDANGEK